MANVTRLLNEENNEKKLIKWRCTDFISWMHEIRREWSQILRTYCKKYRFLWPGNNKLKTKPSQNPTVMLNRFNDNLVCCSMAPSSGFCMPMQTNLLLSQFDAFCSWIFMHIFDMQYWCTYIDYLCSGIVSWEAWRGVEHFAQTQALKSSGRIKIWRHTSTCRHHLLFCHQQWGLCLYAERPFSSQGSPGCIFGQVLLSFHRAAVYVLVFCHESCFRLLSFWWRKHECWPKPWTKECRPPAIQNRLAQQHFFFFL